MVDSECDSVGKNQSACVWSYSVKISIKYWQTKHLFCLTQVTMSLKYKSHTCMSVFMCVHNTAEYWKRHCQYSPSWKQPHTHTHKHTHTCTQFTTHCLMNMKRQQFKNSKYAVHDYHCVARRENAFCPLILGLTKVWQCPCLETFLIQDQPSSFSE